MDSRKEQDLDQGLVQQLREMAMNLLRTGMSLADVVKEVHSVAKTLIRQGASSIDHANLVAEYTREATQGLGSQRVFEKK